MKDPQVRLILDTSAVLAYARGSIDVGETIAEAVDEGQSFGASVVCLAEAARATPGERKGINLLGAHVRFHPLPAPADDWPRLAHWTTTLDAVDLAAALIEAIDRDGYILTVEPDRYTRTEGGENLPLIAV